MTNGDMAFRRFSLHLRAHRLLFGSVFLGVLGAVLLVTALRTPRYTATSTVMIESRQHDISESKSVLSELPAESGVVDSEVRVLQSRDFAQAVAGAMHLEQDPEFHRAAANEPAGVALERTVDAVTRALNIRRSGLTYVIDIAFRSVSPDKAARIANSFADFYVNQQRTIKAQATRQATGLLDQRLRAMRGQVEQAEQQVADYRAANGLLTAEGQSLTEQQLTDLNNQYVTARTAQADAGARLGSMLHEMRADPTGGSVGEALKSDVVRDLRAQRSVASAKVASLSSHLGPRHPDLLAAQHELDSVDAALKAELRRVVAGVRAQADIADAQAASANQAIAAARGTLVTNNAASVKLNELERKAQAVRSVYEGYLARFRETSTQEGMETPDARIIAPAAPPLKPSSPNWPITSVLGILAGLAAACAAVALRQFMDKGVNSARDIEEAFDIPVIGTLPTLASAVETPTTLTPYDYLVEKRRSLYSQAFLSLVSALASIRGAEGGRVIALTSAVPDEGKSVTSLCLLRSMALSGEKVVLVDTDLDRHGLSRLRRREPAITLGMVLAGKAGVDEALIQDEVTGAWLLLVGSNDTDAADLLTTGAMDRLLGELRQRFATVLLDTAPLLAIANARDLAADADAVLLLTRWRHTARDDIFAALQILQRSSASIAGIALTRVDLGKQKAYGYSSLKRYAAYHAG